MKTALAPSIANVVHFTLGELEDSPLNYRRTFDESRLRELAASIAKVGVLQPIVVRIVEDHYEIVVGHRRVRAARLAGLKSIPSTVRQLTDREVLEVQLAENHERDDVPPLEEGEAFARLHKEYGASVEEIEARTGVGRSTIYARMKLVELPETAKAAVRDGTLDASIALLVARIPNPDLQKKAIAELLEDARAPFPQFASYRVAREYLRHNYMLALKAAPFDVKDAELLPAAGPCTTCLKRTGNQPLLFADLLAEKGCADVCTDPSCFRAKETAAKTVRAAKYEAKGVRVLETERWLNAPRGHVRLSDPCWEAPRKKDGKAATWRDVLGEKPEGLAVFFDDRGKAIPIVPAAAARKQAAAEGKIPKAAGKDKRDMDRHVERQALAIAARRLIARASEMVGPISWRLLAALALEEAEAFGDVGFLALYGVTVPKFRHARGEAGAAFWNTVAELDQKRLAGIVLEGLFRLEDEHALGNKALIIRNACEAYGIDYAEILREEKERAKEAKKAATGAGAAKGAKSRKKHSIAGGTPGTCRVCGCTEEDCSQCVDETGESCDWATDDQDLCTRCAMKEVECAEKDRAKAKTPRKKAAR